MRNVSKPIANRLSIRMPLFIGTPISINTSLFINMPLSIGSHYTGSYHIGPYAPFSYRLTSTANKPKTPDKPKASNKLRTSNKKNASSKQSGFTLLELMVVIVILSIFAAMMSMSVGSTESRKNHAFYEHLLDSLEYVRLLSAENMQPMGLALASDNQGQTVPVILKLDTPYAHLEADANADNANNTANNAMQLTAMQRHSDNEKATPHWVQSEQVNLPALPKGVSIDIIPLDVARPTGISLSQTNSPTLQPWFMGETVPKALWFGTGEAAAVRIEIRHNDRLIGDAITLLPDGRLTTDTL